MSFPKYPEYKDSGVEWLGEVPAHWDIKPLKYVATYNDEVLSESTPDDYPIKYVEISDVDEQLGIKNWSEHLFSSAPSRARRILRDGDVLISTVRTYLRAIAPVVEPPENLVGSTGFAAIRPMRGVYHSGLLGYALRAEWFISNIIARSVGVSYPAINASDLVALLLPLPPWKEQQAIAAFLGHETARIDALVEEQHRLIELLKEKRQAMISHAVTKGLDPHVPMKDSGVEWLGEVPVHWEVKRVKHLCALGSDSLRPGPFGSHIKGDDFIEESEFRVYNQATVISGDFLRSAYIDESKYHELVAFSVFPRDVLLTSRGTIGKVAIAPGGVGRGVIHPCLIRLRLDENQIYLPYFKFFFGDTDLAVEQLRLASNSTTIDVVYAENLANLWIALPPIKEQEKIAGNVASRLRFIDSTIGTAVQQVLLLKERRSALISAAVTGKIDVRGWQPPAGPTATTEATQAEMV
ncbi:restriction endonuclease subunit S [Halomonas alkalicola]|uniref:restriction endonuclease subunit S n=1 Tax=Halomonas alkalicola TaxID=1930622 RepID=UPI00265F9CC8|nr:restriction endonuclease subunit S [Halomonas alkalicola]